MQKTQTPISPLRNSTATMRALIKRKQLNLPRFGSRCCNCLRSSPYLLHPGPWAAFSLSQCFWQRSIDRSSCVFSSLLLPPVRLELLSGCLSRLQWGGWAACAPCSRSNSVSLCLSVFRTLLSLSLSRTRKCMLSLSPSLTQRHPPALVLFPSPSLPNASLPPLVLSLSHCIDLPALAFSSCSL